MSADDPLERLRGGDLRSIGRADELAAEALHTPELWPKLAAGLTDSDPLIRMRAADALEIASAHRPERLQPFKMLLLGPAARVPQQEVRWHVALMLPRLALEPAERETAVAILLSYLDDRSRIVKVNAMQGLAELALQDPTLRPRVIPLLRELTRDGSPAMRKRGQKLLQRLGADLEQA